MSRSDFMLDTVITITLYGGDEALIEECFDLCREYELIFSRTDPRSELYALNEKGSMAVSQPLLEVLTLAVEHCRNSGGALDITMGEASALYAFSSDSPRVPEEEELAEAMSHVGYENIVIEGNVVTLKDPEAVLDLGAIAKGYIADRLAEYLVEAGQASAIIDLGGNIRCVGAKPDGSPFRVGVRHPEDPSAVLGAVEVKNASVVTSGVYERAFEQDGVTYHHILHPDTGLPVENGLVSVTIVSDRSVDGDALSTACFVLGLEAGSALIESMEGVSALFVTEDMQLHPVGGFELK